MKTTEKDIDNILKEKNYSEFREYVKSELEFKLRNHPFMKNKLKEIERYKKAKTLYRETKV